MTDLAGRLRAALAGRYTIRRELGRGGMATVYLAEDIRNRRPVALKLLRPDLTAALGLERFLRESTLTARLDHPHILPLLDSGEAEGLLYYVMPYVEGESLRDRLNREKQLPLDDALQITREVADALGYAHSRGIVHRDIKPENILLSGGHARVADFGIARAVTEAGEENLTATGIAIGTPAYMSPEQAAGTRDLDGRSDLYSLGCVLYEMLAGEPPHTGASAQAIIAKRLSTPPPRVSLLRETIPSSVESALMTALQRVAADRFPTAARFIEALGEHTADPAASRVAASARPRVFAGAVVLIMVAAVAVGLLLLRAEPDPLGAIQSLVVLPLHNLANDLEQEYFVQGMHDALIGELAQISALRVISRTSALRYQASHKSVPEIASELDVDAVIEGSVFRAGETVVAALDQRTADGHERLHVATRAHGEDRDSHARTRRSSWARASLSKRDRSMPERLVAAKGLSRAAPLARVPAPLGAASLASSFSAASSDAQPRPSAATSASSRSGLFTVHLRPRVDVRRGAHRSALTQIRRDGNPERRCTFRAPRRWSTLRHRDHFEGDRNVE